MKSKKVVYVAGKYKYLSDLQHIAQQTLILQCAQYILQRGFVPIAPTLQTNNWELSGMFKGKTDSYWIDEYCLPLLGRCDSIYVCSGKEDSDGVKREIEFATKNSLPVFYNFHQLLDYYKVENPVNLIPFPKN